MLLWLIKYWFMFGTWCLLWFSSFFFSLLPSFLHSSDTLVILYSSELCTVDMDMSFVFWCREVILLWLRHLVKIELNINLIWNQPVTCRCSEYTDSTERLLRENRSLKTLLGNWKQELTKYSLTHGLRLCIVQVFEKL